MIVEPNLEAILRTVAKREFIAHLVAKVGLPAIRWRKHKGKPHKTPAKWASYSYAHQRILLHESLKEAPHYVLRHIVYHELVHHLLGAGVDEPHGEEFQRFMHVCPDYLTCRAWEDGINFEAPWR